MPNFEKCNKMLRVCAHEWDVPKGDSDVSESIWQCLFCKLGGAGTKSEPDRGVTRGTLRYQNRRKKTL